MSPARGGGPRLTLVSLSTSCWGAEESLLLLAEHVPAAVRLVAPRGELLDRAWGLGLETAPLLDSRVLRCREAGSGVGPAGVPALLATAAAALARLPLWDRGPVVSFSQWLHLPLALAGRARRVAVALDLHDGPFSRAGAAVQSAAAWSATRNVAVSETALRHLRSWPAGRTRVVPRPVVLPAGLRQPGDQPLPDREQRPLRLVVVGRLDKEKGLDVALEAHERLRAAGTCATLDVVGAATVDEAHARRLRSRWPQAVYHGRLSHESTLRTIAQADLLLSTASQEAFGRTVTEAAMLGVPSVVSGGGPAERVRHGETGFLVPPRDPEALARLLAELAVARPRTAQVGAAARAVAEQTSRPAAVARDWLAAVLP